VGLNSALARKGTDSKSPARCHRQGSLAPKGTDSKAQGEALRSPGLRGPTEWKKALKGRDTFDVFDDMRRPALPIVCGAVVAPRWGFVRLCGVIVPRTQGCAPLRPGL
jgi:hypothetical protein